MSKQHRGRDRWEGLIRRQQAGGMSIAAFCRRMRVPQSSFYYWRRKLRHPGGFAEVTVTPEQPGRVTAAVAEPDYAAERLDQDGGIGRLDQADGIELRLRDCRSIMVWPGFDRGTLIALLDVLENGSAAGSTQKIEASSRNGYQRKTSPPGPIRTNPHRRRALR